MNATRFVTASLFECGAVPARAPVPPAWQQNLIGCAVLALLQDMYNFSLVYHIPGTDPDLTDTEMRHALYPRPGSDVDIYARPIAFRSALLDVADPVHHIYYRRFGFIIIRPDFGLFHSFYSDPFCPNVWHCMVMMLLLAACIFYVTKRWEHRLCADNDECSLSLELMLAITACCQQTPPVFPKLVSRRVTFFFSSLFAYGMYSFYTSNLLSHLVSDRGRDLELDALADSDYKCVVLDTLTSLITDAASPMNEYLIKKKFSVIHAVGIEEGLEAVKNTSAALLSDYATIYPLIKETFSEEELCQLFEVDIFSNVQCYLFTKKGFPMLEQFKIGSLRLLESGLLRRVVARAASPPPCCLSTPAISIQLVHITLPLAVMAGAAVLAVLLLGVERATSARRRPWPFVL